MSTSEKIYQTKITICVIFSNVGLSAYILSYYMAHIELILPI